MSASPGWGGGGGDGAGRAQRAPGSSIMSALVFCFDGSGVRVIGTILEPAGDRFSRPQPEVRVVQRLLEARLVALHAASVAESGVIRRPRGGGFVPIVAHAIDVAAERLKKFPHGVSPHAPGERLLARLALLWLAFLSYLGWEAASRPVPQFACALSSGERMPTFPGQCCGGARP